MIKRLLVANRAEIASRVFRTCRDLGIETVAVHSDADADLPYVAEADLVVRLPGVAPADTYLRGDLLLDAARQAGADAIHPGYGFLSENADFARSVVEAGLTWVGPDPRTIEKMGSKVEAKRLMTAAEVPVLGSIHPEDATEADLPLIVKASAGGGGRGMRIVRDLAALPGEVERAEAEAASAFGDGTVFVERYVERGRHVEVQVWGDAEGRIAVIGERDCSLQRRHQKVVEEAPAPGLSRTTRHRLHRAAETAAETVGYVGAGTVEFLLDEERDEFFFLEMNTRLQVEHPVTELVFHTDLVELQLRAAEGETSEVRYPERPDGHAIEVRLYAEDPARDYQPQSGVLTAFEIPVGEGVRVDTGFAAGNEVTTHYDAMLAKVIGSGRNRGEAARRLVTALRRARIHGVRTNRDHLVAILEDPGFVAGRVSTAFLDDFAPPAPADDPGAPVAAALALAERGRVARTVQHGAPVAWRNVASAPQRTTFHGDDTETVVEWWGGRDGYRADGFTVVAAGPDRVVLEREGVRTTYDVAVVGPAVDVDWPGGHRRLDVAPRFVDPADAVASGSLLAPMPGTVVSVAVEAGQQVEAGQPVLVLEAMKMQHTVSAPARGTVAVVNVQPGAQVASGEVLAVVEGAES
ncbi:biotin carboxylase N-terminal domain-containing protein [Nocardioides sp. SYSU D00038]|uniref:acetyl/propionyl/methylcrotonyl-CoA carboxylase subunit alpha n=1 Tax=Nocardioides sp. SYSU D00038 TaxID=2812554 RepID=UPI0019678772|nr:biotin carboxylase N-terminal domain-containing protein [Nocardioides sp. SYSU D00038]